MTRRAVWLIPIWVVAFGLLILNSAASVYNIKVLKANEQTVTHSREVTRVTNEVMTSLTDAETGQRGYQLTGQDDYLTPYYEAEKAMPGNLKELRALTLNDPFYEDQLDHLELLIRSKLHELRFSLWLRAFAGKAVAYAYILKGVGKEVMDQARQVSAELEAHEEEILKEESKTSAEHYSSATYTAFLGGILTTMMVAMAFVSIRREMTRRLLANAEARKAAEELALAQQQTAETLASLVKIRTAELESTNSLLRDEIVEHARAEARAVATAVDLTRSNEELEKFAYVASHDLQEPLRKIQSFGDRLTKKYREALAGDGQEYVDRMNASAKRMRTLIDDLLAFSRITTKAMPFVKIDLNELLADVLSDLETRLAQADGQVVLGNLTEIVGDPSQMRQLFQNLIGNALKFHKPGEKPVVTIEMQAWSSLPKPADPPAPAGMGQRITVADNGIGFGQEYAEKVFEMFQRLHGRGKYEGTGIGLAICRKIVQRHGGEIVARSQEGYGTTFIIDLPMGAA